MPVIKSAKKRVRQASKRRSQNLAYISKIKSSTKTLLAAIDQKEAKSIDESLKTVYSAYDKAVKKNIVHQKTAARKKARLNRLAKEAKSVKTAPKKPASTKKTATSTKKTTTKKSTKK